MCISLPDIGGAVSIVVVSNTNVDDTVGVITVDFDVVSTELAAVLDVGVTALQMPVIMYMYIHPDQ